MQPLPLDLQTHSRHESSTRGRRFSTGLAALLVLASAAQAADAQGTGRIQGRVTDATSGGPLSEVQVYLQGAQLGGLTRTNGVFIILNVPVGTYELRAERIGLAPAAQQITVTAGTTVEVDFRLETQALGLDEIVVTGTAGAARRREIGNTIAQINTADLPQRPVNVSDMLQSVAPGIEVTAGGGGAGQGSKIRLRGTNSLEMGSDPIIYIDGVRMMTGGFPVQAAKDQGNRAANVTQSPLDMLNPNDIERIEVIKGSAATTLYGTEASAGVIQVFTKRGSQGAPVWSVESQQGTMWSQRMGIYDDPTPVPAGRTYPVSGSSKYLYMDPWICTGFLKCGEYTHTAHTQMYSASVRGGGANLQYFVSGELFDEKGNTPKDEMEKWTTRGNFTFTPLPELQLQLNSAYMNQWQSNSPQGNNAEGLELNVFRQNQNYFTDNNPEFINRIFDWDLESTIERFTSGGTATYSPIANLTNRFTIGYDFSNQYTYNLRPFGFYAHPEGIFHTSTYQKRVLTFDYVGSYSFDVLANVRSNFSWGGQSVGDRTYQIEGYGRNFPGAIKPTISSAATALGYEDSRKIWNAGFFFQNVFDIDNKYFLTGGLRVDGNSAFGKGFGLQLYPKASAAWVISDEGFWNPGWGQVKLRTAYGQAGRAPGAFDAVRTWSNTPLAGEVAFTPQNVGNADLGPEVTREFEGGFDGSWLIDRVRAGFTYYNQLTKDALLNVQQSPSAGFTQNQLMNVGEIANTGMEVSLDVTAIRRPSFAWDLGVNLTTNESEVLSHVLPERVGRAIQYSLHTIVHNGDAAPTTPTSVELCTQAMTRLGLSDISQIPSNVSCRETNVYRGSDLPTKTLNGYTTVRLPYGISLFARGEYRGGHYNTGINPIAIGRSVRSPACFPYYANQENVQLKPDTPALWVARCLPSLATGYSMKADYFKLRSISATVPVDFVFPERVQNATLTLSMGNVMTWSRESLFGTYGFENFGNAGIQNEGASIGISNNERIPPPTTLRVALRVTF
jgi:TonB-dependent starch-binding outer membrane protein SusC